MAYPVDVFFTGLMLICFQGQPNCPQGKYTGKDTYQNTAWVVKADGRERPEKVCGWYRGEETRLEVKFLEQDFKTSTWDKSVVDCRPGKNNYKLCEISGDIKFVCLSVGSKSEASFSGLESLPRLEEIDRRLAAPKDLRKYDDYVRHVIHFPNGAVTNGLIWPVKQDGTPGVPTPWYRSDGSMDAALPRQLSDRLKVTYSKVDKLIVKECTGRTLITFELDKNNAPVIFQNVATYPPIPDYKPDDGGGYDYLTYLIWYYPLGEWDTENGNCPDYEKTKKDPVLLRCVSKKDTSCSYNPSADTDSRFWPPMLGSGPIKQ